MVANPMNGMPATGQRQHAEDELQLLDGILVGLRRREEVFAVVQAAADRTEAHRRLRSLLGVDEQSCQAILDLQVSRWTRAGRRAVERRASDLRAQLAKKEG